VYIQGLRVGFVVTDLYEDRELFYPYYRLREAGATVEILGRNSVELGGMYGIPIEQDLCIADARPADYDGLVIPGAEHSGEYPELLTFIREVHRCGSAIAAISHGARVLAAAGLVAGRRITSARTIRDELIDAGARWVDQEVVCDGNLITSRKTDDLPAFCRALIDLLG
jgi:protease I